MGYGYKIEDGKKFVVKIYYLCHDCEFTTENKQEEEAHYATGHYLSSKIHPAVPYDEKLHGDWPSWVREN